MRTDVVDEARKYIGAKFGHQGRRKDTLDCGGLILLVGHNLNLTTCEEYGYAKFPTNGRFEHLLETFAVKTGFVSHFPHNLAADDFEPGDLVSFDYGGGVQHVAFVTKFDGRRFWVIDALQDYGVTEHPLAPPFTKRGTILGRYLVPLPE